MSDRLTLPEPLLAACRPLFPTLDFSRVRFHRGLPWFVPGWAVGFAAPDFFSSSYVNVFLRADLRASPLFLAVAHELVHVLQFQRCGGGGRGLGLAHPGVALYFACALADFDFGASPRNAAEAEAYEYEARLRAALEAGGAWFGWAPVAGAPVKHEPEVSFSRLARRTRGLAGAALGAAGGANAAWIATGRAPAALAGALAGGAAGWCWGFTCCVLGAVGALLAGLLGLGAGAVEAARRGLFEFDGTDPRR